MMASSAMRSVARQDGMVSEGDRWAAALRVIEGTNGDDRLRGTDADDQISGKGGNDRLEGEDGDDVLLGGAGNDRLQGDDGRDRLKGGADDDRLRGDDDSDVLTGGGGSDTFQFDADDGKDRITDFERADFIRFSIDPDDSGPRQFEDLTVTARNGGTVIAYGSDGGTIFLAGVAMNEISEAQFIFI